MIEGCDLGKVSDLVFYSLVSILTITMGVVMVDRKQEGSWGAKVRNRRRVLSLSGAVADPPIFITITRSRMMMMIICHHFCDNFDQHQHLMMMVIFHIQWKGPQHKTSHDQLNRDVWELNRRHNLQDLPVSKFCRWWWWMIGNIASNWEMLR